MTDSERERDNNEEASGNVSLFMGLKMIGIMISSYFGGFLLEYVPKKTSKLTLFIYLFSLYDDWLYSIDTFLYCFLFT
jgi:hypothetical protein